MGATPDSTLRELEKCLANAQHAFLDIPAVLRELQEAFDAVQISACRNRPAAFARLDPEQQSKIRRA